MSCNIYEDPDLMMKVRYGKRVRASPREKEERVVEIYESSDLLPDLHVGPSRQDGGARTKRRNQDVQRNNYKTTVIILIILCLMLLVGISILLKLYLMVLLKQESNSTQIICPAGNKNQTQGITADGWYWFRQQCLYASKEKKNWTESREDCRRRGADLVIISSKDKHELVKQVEIHGDSWIGLETVSLPRDFAAKWKWIDGSDTTTYSSWKVGEPGQVENDFKAYTDLQGNWMTAKNGSKHWICEKTTC